MEEFFEVFFGTRIQARGIVWNMEPMGELRRYHHAHIITISALLTTLGSMLDSLDPSEKVTNIVRSLYVGDVLDLADLHECFIALIIFTFWLNIGIIPKADNIVLIAQLEYWHSHIGPTADMDEYLWFLFSCWTIESILQYILRYLARESWDDEPCILFEELF
jgi:hypothetical protein